MQREADTFISNNDKAFIIKALQEETRLDGRRPYDFRKIKFEFGLDGGSATVHLGSTRVMTCITAELEAPYPDRPSEGAVRFDVELGPMASPAFDAGRPGEDAIEIARLIERGLRQSGAIDQEALCVMAGRKVWSLRVTTHVLDHCGNLIDAACLSALAALLAFRKPEVTVGGTNGTDIIVHSPDVKEPLPLTLHHLPLSVTFALYEDANLLVVDPSLKEEAAMLGSCTIMANAHKEVCAVHKADGIGLSPQQFMRCVRLALVKVEEITQELKRALEVYEVTRVQARVRRHRGALPQESRHVAVMVGGGDEELAAAAAAAKAAAAQAAVKMEVSEEESSDTSTSSGSSEEEEEDEAAAAQGGGGAAGTRLDDAQAEAVAAAARRLGGLGAGPTGGTSPGGKPAGARLAGSIRQQHPQQRARAAAGSGEEQAGRACGTTGGVSSSSLSKRAAAPPPKYDELEAIAAVIAGVKPGASPGPEPDLKDAILHHKVKGKKQKS